MADMIVAAMFDGLVKRAGGVEAVAAVLEARTGVNNPSTVSKMCRGHIGVTVSAMEAVEDALKSYPMTRRLYERTASAVGMAADLRALLADSALATGTAHAALIRALSPDSPGGEDLSVAERAEVLSSMRHARDVLNDMIDAAEAME
ncbi:hypothetical protein [Marinovum algicola]|uniref:hypothetical protein n=1 Tax=Marinovum algicola TaxID=42444 RepID=UPI003B527E6C